jgi:short-subunit dehydrogenase
MSALAGKEVLLTGASGGIGSVLAAALAARGARVIAVGRDPGRLAALARGVTTGSIEPLVADLADTDGADRVLAALDARGRRPAIVVLGAAVSEFGWFANQGPDAARAMLDVNLLAPMRLVHALLPRLERLPGAAVVAIGSTFGSIGYPGFAAYCATKFGLRGFIEALAREHAGGAVRFQYLSPRATRTALNPAAVDALNAELGTAVDAPEAVAAALVTAIERGQRRLQIGWPEKLFARLNGLLPALVDRALAGQLAVIRRHALSSPAAARSAAAPVPAHAINPPLKEASR